MSEDCALCRILSGQIRLDPLCETEALVAMLNRWEPLSRGHVLIVPKRHVASLHEMSVAELSEVLPVVRKLAMALELRDYNVIQNNGALAHQTIFHAHFHLVPKWSEASGLGLNWNIVRDVDQGATYARMIRQRLEDLTSQAAEKQNKVLDPILARTNRRGTGQRYLVPQPFSSEMFWGNDRLDDALVFASERRRL